MIATGAGGGSSSADRLTHVDEHGKAHMVDVTGKPLTRRVAEARCTVRASAEAVAALGRTATYDDLMEEARIAGIMAAKQTSSLLPLCHPIPIDAMTVDVTRTPVGLVISAVAEITERTGVEMEALTACAVTALVLLQPLLDLDPRSSIEELTLWAKSGGRSGDWERSADGRMGWKAPLPAP
ncbi:MAG: cyclic pyranopterin monophosphate synthase MoaC [Acidimicrobiales bacterium]|jgi:cyclic pyranopterin phosphate synthase